MTALRLCLLAALSTAALSLPAHAANDDDVYLARQYLRCASFYVFGARSVAKPELRQQMQKLANLSIYSAEQLMDRDRPLVKTEYDAAMKKFLAETASGEVKADTRGFLNYMGQHCNALRSKHQARFPPPDSSPDAAPGRSRADG